MTDTTAAANRAPKPDSILRKLGKAILLMRESRIGMFGAFLVLFWVMIAIFVPLLPLHEPLTITRGSSLMPMLSTDPTGAFHWLGTDDRSRDILSRLLWGSRLVLFWATAATLVAYTMGMLLGVMAGYKAGWWDEVISFIGNVLLSFPLLVLYLVILTSFGANSSAGQWLKAALGVDSAVIAGIMIIVAVMFGTAPQVARIVRGLVLDLKTRDYIAAAEVRGERPLYIMIVELLPNARGPLIVDACLRLGYVTITIALLGYLALGLPPPDPDWGKMISDAQKWGSTGMNAMLWPAFAISSLVLGLNLLADGLREISLRD
jgi:peptide/nickel transport system permease protein